MTAILYLAVALIVMSGAGFALSGLGLFLQSAGGGVLIAGLAMLGLGTLTFSLAIMFAFCLLTIGWLLAMSGGTLTFRWSSDARTEDNRQDGSA